MFAVYFVTRGLGTDTTDIQLARSAAEVCVWRWHVVDHVTFKNKLCVSFN